MQNFRQVKIWRRNRFRKFRKLCKKCGKRPARYIRRVSKKGRVVIVLGKRRKVKSDKYHPLCQFCSRSLKNSVYAGRI